MANKYFNWPGSLRRFVRFDAARSEDVNDALDDVSTAMDGVETDTKRSIKLPASGTDQLLDMAPEQRANLVIGFDLSGTIAALPGGGRFAGDWATGTAYLVSETFRDPDSKNIYSTAIAHTSATIAGDLAAGRIRLAVNVVDVELAKDAAAVSAGVAAQQAQLATTNGAAQVALAAEQAALATTKAGEASTSAAGAAASATTALESKNAAANSAAESEASRIAASKLNLGNKATPPAADNQGAALLAGATYYDTTLSKWRVWTGAAWGDGISALAGVSSVNGQTGDVTIQGAEPTLQGDPAPYVTQTKTYQITNYNSFSSYTVSASAGTAILAGDTITFTAPVTAGNVSLTLTVDGQPTAFVITVQAAGVAKPTNTSPADGATGVTESPTLQSSAFVAFGLTDTHLASRWTVYQGGTQIHSSGWRTDALTSYTVPGGVMAVSTAYTWTVEHRGNALGDSPASTATSFTTAATFNSYIATPTATPANFGDALDGGFYAGMVWEQLTQSSTSMAIATGSKTFAVPSMTSAPIVYGGQTVEVRSRANPANKFVGTVTGALGTSLTINVTSVGGSGTFSDWSVMARHRIIVAPKASGEHAGIALKNANTALPTACQTLTEGFAATQAMRDADTSTVYPAAHWARNLNIGGRTDWYIPARDELELCWRNLKPTTTDNYVTANRPTAASFNYANNGGSYGDTAATHGTNNNSSPTGAAYTTSVPGQTAATAFRAGGAEAYEFGSSYYWSSSDYDASNAWYQGWYSSSPGNQFNGGKSGTYRVRAVRRSVI